MSNGSTGSNGSNGIAKLEDRGTELSIRKVGLSFGGLKACDNISFDVARGSITSVIGPNGAGKTTLFNILSGALRCDTGEITHDFMRTEKMRSHEIARTGLIRTFQGAKIINRLSVIDNVMLAAQNNPGESIWRMVFPWQSVKFEREARERAMYYLNEVGLTKMAGEFGGILSGGQRKLLDLARAMMADPKMLLLDEPFAGVNPTLVEQLVKAITDIRNQRGVTFLLIEHDLETVTKISDKIIVMARGTVIAEGPPNSIYENDIVIEAYLGSRRGSGK